MPEQTFEAGSAEQPFLHITPLSNGEGMRRQGGAGEGLSLLSSAYFPPIQWVQKLHRYGKCVVDCGENFVKQTFRNRCVIATANGVQALTVPIEKYEGAKCPMRDIRISDHGEWRHLHWNALVSAYGESPFFDYYADDLRPFFERRWEFLADFNMEIVATLCSLLDVRPDISTSSTYVDAEALAAAEKKPVADFRNAIRPKHPLPDADFEPQPYYQVYASRHGFLPNMSVLDLLFNEGPEGIFML